MGAWALRDNRDSTASRGGGQKKFLGWALRVWPAKVLLRCPHAGLEASALGSIIGSLLWGLSACTTAAPQPTESSTQRKASAETSSGVAQGMSPPASASASTSVAPSASPQVFVATKREYELSLNGGSMGTATSEHEPLPGGGLREKNLVRIELKIKDDNPEVRRSTKKTRATTDPPSSSCAARRSRRRETSRNAPRSRSARESSTPSSTNPHTSRTRLWICRPTW